MSDWLLDLLILWWWPDHWRWGQQLLLIAFLLGLLAGLLIAIALLL